jgi:hypothetical protein
MFTGYLVGFAAFRALFDHSPAMVLSKLCFPLFFYKLKVLLTKARFSIREAKLGHKIQTNREEASRPSPKPQQTTQNKIIPNMLNYMPKLIETPKRSRGL